MGIQKWAIIGLALLSMQGAWGAAGGGWVSGGTGQITDEANPWFLGEQPIPYCLSIEPGFPVSEVEIDRIIQESFAAWKQVFRKYGLYQLPLGNGEFLDQVPRAISVDAVRLPSCTDPDHQLEFKLGRLDGEVQDYFKTHSKVTVGFAHRKSYDHQTFRTGGYIWISPNAWLNQSENYYKGYDWPKWQTSHRLKSTLTHEIGHVLGIPHLSMTLMGEDLMQALLFENDHYATSSEIESDLYRLNPYADPKPIVSKRVPLCAALTSELGLAADQPIEEQCHEEYRFSVPGDLYNAKNWHRRTITVAIRLKGTGQEFISESQVSSFRGAQAIRFQSPQFTFNWAIGGWGNMGFYPLFDGDTGEIGIFEIAGKKIPFELRYSDPITIHMLNMETGRWSLYRL